MNIPSRVNPLGYDNSMPPGYIRAEFLESTGAQYIDTDFYSENMRSLSVCVKKLRARGSNYMNIISFVPRDNEVMGVTGGPVGAIGIGTGSQEATTLSTYSASWRDSLRRGDVGYENPVTLYKDGNMAKLLRVDGTDISTTAYGNYNLTADKFPETHAVRLFANIPQANRGIEPATIRLYWAKAESEDISANFIPAIDPEGKPCMFDLVSKQPFRNKATSGSDFVVGLDIRQALSLANLPVTDGGGFTISMPWEAAFDANVKSALVAARAKGWTIPVQYREPAPATENIGVDFLKIAGYIRYINATFPHFRVPMPVVENSDNWEFVTTHSVDFSTEESQVEGVNAGGSVQSMFYAVTTAKKLYAGSAAGTATYTEFVVNDQKHSFAFRQKGQLSYVVYDGEEVKLNKDTTIFPSEIGVFGALRFGNAGYYYPFNGKKYNWKFIKNGTIIHNLIPVLDSDGTPCMYDTVGGQNLYNATVAAEPTPFVIGFDTTEKAALGLAKLPVVEEGELTVSLPAEAETDELVQEAIIIAGNRGWTIIEQLTEQTN